jgi:ABC-type antimicrobial peptide transport system permease subunit
LPVFAMKAMQTQVDQSMFTEQADSGTLGVFGMLAATGLYGVTAYTAARRTLEIGIRMALGADRTKVIRLVIRDVVLRAVIGMGTGRPCAWWHGWLVRS